MTDTGNVELRCPACAARGGGSGVFAFVSDLTNPCGSLADPQGPVTTDAFEKTLVALLGKDPGGLWASTSGGSGAISRPSATSTSASTARLFRLASKMAHNA
jgi:hypothetical protein